MDREVEFLRHRCEYLERMLENCMSSVSSLEARVSENERRPVAIILPDEGRGDGAAECRTENERLIGYGITVWEGPRGRQR